MKNQFSDNISLVLSVLFFMGLEFLTVTWSFYWYYFGLIVFLVIVGTLLTQREDVKARGPHVMILPLSYIGSVFLFHLYVSQGLLQQAFIVLATLGFYFLVARGIEWAFPTWNWFFTSVTFFLFTAGAYGLRFHLQFPLWAVILLVGVITFLLSYHVLVRAELPTSASVFWSFLLALIMSEFLGGFAFLPISYLVVSGSLFVLFYVAIHLLQRHLYKELSRRFAMEYMIFGLVAISIILLTARWSVV